MHQSENENGLGVIREEHDVIVGVAGLWVVILQASERELIRVVRKKAE